MTAPRPRTPAFAVLGPAAAQVLEAIKDKGLKARVYRAVAVCADALRVVDQLDLSPYEDFDNDDHDLTVWNALAPKVREVLVTVQRASAGLKGLFPAPSADVIMSESSDLDAALSDLGARRGPPPPIRDQREHEIDQIVGRTSDIEEAAEGVHQLAGMLQVDFIAFGQRLRNPAVVTDRWLLLGELQELKAKCTHCLEAVVATLVQPFTTQALNVILPRYVDATARSLVLRERLVDLAHDIGFLNAKAQRCSKERALTMRHALTVRLNEFVEHEAYRYLRPVDKRELSKFRIAMKRYEEEIDDLDAFRRLVEGFAKFLEVLRSINQRELLMQYDLQQLQTATMMIEAEADDGELWAVLRPVFGREPRLDDLIRSVRRGGALDRDALREVLEAAEAQLRASMS